MMEDLPLMDLWTAEIISQLPVKALARLKCVSKSWNALISRLQNQTVLLKHEVRNQETGENESRFSFFTADYDYDYDYDNDGDPYFEHLDHPRFGPDIVFRGHSHGIICLSHRGSDDITLYNPVTGEVRHLPPSFLPSRNVSVPGLHYATDGIGFGYDPECRDLKVVRIVCYYLGFGVLSRSTTEVYELGKDGWREIKTKTPVPGDTNQLYSFDMYYRGFFYWWASDNHGSEIILCFDISNAVFGNILMPDAYSAEKSRTLGVLNGSIVLLNVPDHGHEKSFHVWELGSSFSWTKLFTIGPVFGIDRPVVFVGSDELLMVDEKGQLILCNIFNTQRCKPLPIKGLPDTIEAAPFFVKTLLSVNGGDT